MSGFIGGEQVNIQEKWSQVVYVHCSSHVLNHVLQQPQQHLRMQCIFSNI
jgi:hypothetical protein